MSKFENLHTADFAKVSLPPVRLRDMRLKDILDLVNREMARVSGEAMPGGALARA